MYISGVDWNPTTNLIISCSYDKNIYVWNYNTTRDEWQPNLVVFKSKLSLLSVKWSKKGDKFLASGAGNQKIVGFFEKDLNWWKGEEFKFHKSAVTCAAFDPTGMFAISGSTDLKISIHSCFLDREDYDTNNKDSVSLPNPKVR